MKSTEVSPLLTRLVQESSDERMTKKDIEAGLEEKMALEVQIAAGTNLPEKSIIELGELTPFTCPECRGALVWITEGRQFRFRCHTGHGFTADALLEGLMKTIGDLIWQVTRGFQEATMLLEHIGKHMQSRGEVDRAEIFLEKARELNKRASHFQKNAIDHESLSTEKLDPPQPADN